MLTRVSIWTDRSAPHLLLLIAALSCLANLLPPAAAEPGYRFPFTANYQARSRRDQISDQIMELIPGGDIWLTEPVDESTCNDGSKITVAYWPQPLDHFNSSNKVTWQQHYHVNERWFNDTGTQNIFLQIEGESPMNPKWVCNGEYTYLQAAARHNALVLQLEHRFFGANLGDEINDLSTANLKYLTTEQAIADIDKFLREFVADRKFTNAKVVAFGGSYPATMAAYLRQVYPKITQGAVASSAPLRPVVDFWQYARVMEVGFRATSEVCYNNMKRAFALLKRLSLSETGRDMLDVALKIEPPIGSVNEDVQPENVAQVLASVFDAFQGVVQYTYDGANPQFYNASCPRRNLACACEHFEGTMHDSDLLNGIYRVHALSHGVNWQEKNPNVPLDSDYAKYIKKYSVTTLNNDTANDEGAMRGWMWLSCNEYGWLQSTSNNALFSDIVPISYFEMVCRDMFDGAFDATTIDNRVMATAARHGTNTNFKATNLLLTNGGYDPWSSLGVQTSDDSQHLVARVTPAAAHCSDMYPPYDGEPAGLVETRRIFHEQVDYFLSLDSVYNGGDGGPDVTQPSASTKKGAAYLTPSLSACLALVALTLAAMRF